MSDETKPPKPPSTYREFVERFPHLGEAWEAARREEESGPIGHKERRLLKLAVAFGAMRQGAVHSSVRKAVAAGATEDEIFQSVALAASTLGFPSAVAIYSWVTDTLREG